MSDCSRKENKYGENMKRIFILIALAVGLSASVYAQTNSKPKNSPAEMLISYEKQTWELVKRKDIKTFADFFAEDFYGIYPGAENVTKPQLLESLEQFDLKDYKLSNFKVTMLNKDAAIINYQAESQAMENGKEVSLRVAVTSGWAKRKGKWLGVFFREYALN
jgi:hypothetical protein